MVDVSFFSSGTCSQSFSTRSASYGSSQLSIIVGPATSPDCPSNSSQSLSTGAIIGIAVGAIIGGILLTLVIVLISKALRKHYTTTANKEIALQQFTDEK
jgi:Ca2+/Na+ antiporter